MKLLDRAIYVHGAETKKGKVADTLPLSAVYGLLCGLEHRSFDGIRHEDRNAFLAHFEGDTKAVVANMNAGNDVLMDRKLATAGTASAGYAGGRIERYGYMTLTDDGERWAKRLRMLSHIQPKLALVTEPTLSDCGKCGCLHRTDVACPW